MTRPTRVRQETRRAGALPGDLAPRGAVDAMSAAEVRDYLLRTPRQIPSRYFYDALGSALFDAICELPWYAIPRAELGLLESHATAILSGRDGFSRIVELGPGSGAKLAALIAAGRVDTGRLEVHLVDVSPAALDAARRTIEAVGVTRVIGHARSYADGLRQALAAPSRGATLVLCLGSNLGNFHRTGADALLRAIRTTLREGDALLLGADLVKPEAELLLAYDDPIGVTAAFNRNVLHRMNRELGANFAVSRFRHRAVWNARESRVEMHLVTTARQEIRVPAARLSFAIARGDFIWTESSYKYTPADLVDRFERAGFDPPACWTDERLGFALTLAHARGRAATRLLRRPGASATLEAGGRGRSTPGT